MLAIIDYGAGNLTSVSRALAKLGIPSEITADPERIAKASGIIFPGVGQAAQAMAALAKTGLDQCLKQAAAKNQPLFGICVGCQIMLESSEEGSTRTLGLAKGKCVRFTEGLKEADGTRINIPHMGWNNLIRIKDCPLLEGIPENAEFYFVHSYYAVPEASLEIARTSYGQEFCSFYGKDNFWAAQFHPEKSGEAGLKILSNFNAWCERAL